MLALLPSAVRAMDQPTIDGINTYTISGKVRSSGIKVALTGLGADELFAGYPTFRSVPRMETFLQLANYSPRLIRHCVAVLFKAAVKAGDRNRKLTELIAGNESLHPYAISRMLFTTRQQREILAETMDHCRPTRVLNPDGIDIDRADPVNRLSYLELRNYMLNTLLRDSDCMSMAHGVELRLPFLDSNVVEYMLTIPGNMKVEHDKPKPLLARATKEMLPRAVVDRPKRGFVFPFEHWLRRELRPEVERVLARQDGPLSEFFDSRAVRGIWEDFLQGRTNWARPWSIYIAKKWTEQHLGVSGAH
jgi:asparagine synthase (glutamine-hydrolysing)